MEATAPNREGNRPHDLSTAAQGGPRGRRRRPGWIALVGGLASLVAILGWFELTSYRHIIALVLGGEAQEAAAGPAPAAGIATGAEHAAGPAEESRPEPPVERGPRALAAQRTVELDRFVARLRSCRAKGSTVTCDFVLESTRRDVTVFLRGSSRLIDFAGNESLASSLAFGQSRIEDVNGHYWGVHNRLVVNSRPPSRSASRTSPLRAAAPLSSSWCSIRPTARRSTCSSGTWRWHGEPPSNLVAARAAPRVVRPEEPSSNPLLTWCTDVDRLRRHLESTAAAV